MLQSQLLQPAYVTRLSSIIRLCLFNLLAVLALPLLSPLFALQPTPLWKPRIAHSDVRQLISGINFLFVFFTFISCIIGVVVVHYSFNLSFQCKIFSLIFPTVDSHAHQSMDLTEKTNACAVLSAFCITTRRQLQALYINCEEPGTESYWW